MRPILYGVPCKVWLKKTKYLLVRNNGGTFWELLLPEREQIHVLYLDFLCIWSIRNILSHEFSSLQDTSSKNRVCNGNIAYDCNPRSSQYKYYIWDTVKKETRIRKIHDHASICDTFFKLFRIFKKFRIKECWEFP